MKTFLSGLITAALVNASAAFAADNKPTIVLVHGAFADASSWTGVIERLEKDGYSVVAASNPLRSVKGDAEYIARIVASIKTSVVLVGHSYGGNVISEAATSADNVKSLVYVAAFAPDVGETAASLSSQFPGSTLSAALGTPVDLPGGESDLYIIRDKFHLQFAADLNESQARLMAAGQRPITAGALNESATKAAWKSKPSWFVYGDADKNIPAKTLGWMAARANARETVVVKGASHVVMTSHPDVVTRIIEEAASVD
ncbi:alpha/beta hydrolase [Phyllobacterium sp. SB3]|uniref:alpha/beta fold hydrolase n=1 Tax=Phyllobacterium sp. SB3 TaxID=3156073 RepID=UPI0032B006B0